MTTATYIDSLCAGCGKRLRVAAEHAGKQARCPHCHQVYVVPPHSTVTASGALAVKLQPAAGGDSWQLKTPEGLSYGPVTKDVLDQWCREGRITPKSQLLAAGDGQWRWAEEIYPEVAKALVMTPLGPPVEEQGAAAKPASYYASGVQPHRGVLVLVLSILGITTFCAACSVVAILLGRHDLKAMKAGKIDPSGRGLTLAGIILGLVWTIGWVVFMTFWLLAVTGLLG
jgi:DNA-directed RNA polymerase subunit RPC12/RpoP